MKLTLEKYKDIHILIASGDIDPKNFAVLRAGIKKQIQDGKNKMILELPDAKSFAPEILRELAQFNLLAAELSGQIVLSKIDPTTRIKIESFSKPPVVYCFDSKEKAIEFFYPPSETPSQEAASTEAASPETAQPGASQEETLQRYKDDIRNLEINVLGSLRKQNATLEAENKELTARLKELTVQRRDPPDLPAWKEKVSQLEEELKSAMEQINSSSSTPTKHG